MTRGYFTIVRFVPDVARQEQINVGAIVVFPSQSVIAFDVRVSSKRARCLSDSFDQDEIDSLRVYLQKAIDHGTFRLLDRASGDVKYVPVASAEFLAEIASRRSLSTIQLGEIGTVEFPSDIVNDVQIRKLLDDLIQQYVIYKRPSREREQKEPKLKSQIRKDLVSRDFIGTSLDQGKVVPNALLEPFDWKYDFAIKNGSTKVFETLDLMKFALGKIYPVFGDESMKYMKLSEAVIYFEDKNNPFRAYVVYNADSEHAAQFENELKRLERYGELINYATLEGRRRFMEIIEESIRGHQGQERAM